MAAQAPIPTGLGGVRERTRGGGEKLEGCPSAAPSLLGEHTDQLPRGAHLSGPVHEHAGHQQRQRRDPVDHRQLQEVDDGLEPDPDRRLRPVVLVEDEGEVSLPVVELDQIRDGAPDPTARRQHVFEPRHAPRVVFVVVLWCPSDEGELTPTRADGPCGGALRLPPRGPGLCGDHRGAWLRDQSYSKKLWGQPRSASASRRFFRGPCAWLAVSVHRSRPADRK